LHAGRSNWILGNGVRDQEWWMLTFCMLWGSPGALRISCPAGHAKRKWMHMLSPIWSPKTPNSKEGKSTGFDNSAGTCRALGLDFFEVLLKFIAGGPLGCPFLLKIQKVIATQVKILHDQNKPIV